VPFEG